MKDFHFDAISAFENYEIEKNERWSRCGDDQSSELVAQLLWQCPWWLSIHAM